ncbi:pigment-dispersing hormone type 2 [Musca domestica]|uniref:Pigment-dispersing hormone type 2 n=1 Tax=Musca domestica TaxID=7370 RepID=A0A1I8MCB8_MUSDO|nr:pigment-dispersing hormone type 2 [Musca domestica]
MANINGLICCLMCLELFLCIFAAALPAQEDERYFEKQLNRELLNNWLSSARGVQAINNPCRYYPDNTWSAAMPKRNSELINSLLSLPKSMNDAGKSIIFEIKNIPHPPNRAHKHFL